MRRVQRWRYYCEFCKKSGGSGGAMKQHEDACTANPGRDCRMCALSGDSSAEPLPVLRATFDGVSVTLVIEQIAGIHYTRYAEPDLDDLKRRVEILRASADHCPACMLAALRQTGLAGIVRNANLFDFKKESDSFLRDAYAAREDQRNYG